VDAHEVQPRHDGAGAVSVEREAVLVERSRAVDPRLVIRSEPPGEHDRAELAEGDSLERFGVHRLRRLEVRPREARLESVLPEVAHDLGVALVAPRDAGLQIGGEQGVLAVGPEEVSEECHTNGVQGPVVEVVAAVAPARLDVPPQPRGGLREILDAVVEAACLVEPPGEVVPVDPARQPARTAAGEEDVTAREVQLLGDLAARLATAHDEHGSGGELVRVAVLLDVDLKEVLRE
jgi:hypothetical protein